MIRSNYLVTNVCVEYAASIFNTEEGGSIFLRNLYINPIASGVITIKVIPVEILPFVTDYLYLYMIWPFVKTENAKHFSQETGERIGIRIKCIPFISQHVTTMPTC